jgi:uncharacterized protein YfiM (DUF2279 family)
MRRFAVVILSFHALSSASDQWFGPDKVKHFFLGAFVQSASFAVLQMAGVRNTAALAGASGMTVAVAATKELRDRSTGAGTPSFRDFGWGVAGAAAVSPLLLRTK